MAYKPTRTTIRPPDKGSFPLDHDGECKESMTVYMRCMAKAGNDIAACRLEAKDYLACRMDKNLMKREEWDRLGYGDLAAENTNKR